MVKRKMPKSYIFFVVFPLLGLLLIPLFQFLAYNKFIYQHFLPLRQLLYRFVGWTLIPSYTVYGIFICVVCAAVFGVYLYQKKINIIQFLIVIVLNLFAWLSVAYYYISSA
jgi:uncharacterized membrane protein